MNAMPQLATMPQIQTYEPEPETDSRPAHLTAAQTLNKMEEIWQDEHIPATYRGDAAMLWRHLENLTHRNGLFAFAGRESLMQSTGLSRNRLDSILRELANAGYIYREGKYIDGRKKTITFTDKARYEYYLAHIKPKDRLTSQRVREIVKGHELDLQVSDETTFLELRNSTFLEPRNSIYNNTTKNNTTTTPPPVTKQTDSPGTQSSGGGLSPTDEKDIAEIEQFRDELAKDEPRIAKEIPTGKIRGQLSILQNTHGYNSTDAKKIAMMALSELPGKVNKNAGGLWTTLIIHKQNEYLQRPEASPGGYSKHEPQALPPAGIPY